MKFNTIFFSALLMISVIIFYFCTRETVAKNPPIEFSDSGVSVFYVLHSGFEKPPVGSERIINKNNFPVIVRCVWQFKGETTQWVEKLNPQQEKVFDVSHQHGFYVYTDSQPQNLIGFVLVDPK